MTPLAAQGYCLVILRLVFRIPDVSPAYSEKVRPDRRTFVRSLHAKISLRPMSKVFPFSSLPTADLVIDAVYEGGTKGNTADDVLGKLIPGAGNQGGFRAVGSWDAPRLVILYSSIDDADWPDFSSSSTSSTS